MDKCRLSSLGACIAAFLIVSPACIESEDVPDPIATGAAGTSGLPTTGAAGTTAAAGTNGGAGTTAAAGTSGAAGTSAAAGTTGSAGTSAAAGTNGAAGTGSAGTRGSAGTSGPDGGAGPGDAGTDAPPTFTMVYNLILGPTPQVPASSCAGAPCHLLPGGGKGIEHIDMNTKASAYVGVKKFVVVGNPAGSKFFTEVNTGAMPEAKPKLPANLIKMISDWIRAGALDN